MIPTVSRRKYQTSTYTCLEKANTGPDGEQYAIDVVILLAVGAQNTVNVPVFTFSKQVQVEVR